MDIETQVMHVSPLPGGHSGWSIGVLKTVLTLVHKKYILAGWLKEDFASSYRAES